MPVVVSHNAAMNDMAITTRPLHRQLPLLVLIVGWDFLSLLYIYLIITIYGSVIQALLIMCDVRWDILRSLAACCL